MAKCACIKNRSFDFILETSGCDMLRYQDLSEWAEGDRYELPESYYIDISMGGAGKRISVKRVGVTAIPVEKLGVTGRLNDGIVCIKTDTCDDSYIRYRLITCKVDCCIDKYIFQLQLRNAPDQEYKEVEKIQRMLDIAKRSAEVKDIEFSRLVFEEVKNKIEDLNCECKCK